MTKLVCVGERYNKTRQKRERTGKQKGHTVTHRWTDRREKDRKAERTHSHTQMDQQKERDG
jgi:hypothetical protein